MKNIFVGKNNLLKISLLLLLLMVLGTFLANIVASNFSNDSRTMMFNNAPFLWDFRTKNE